MCVWGNKDKRYSQVQQVPQSVTRRWPPEEEGRPGEEEGRPPEEEGRPGEEEGIPPEEEGRPGVARRKHAHMNDWRISYRLIWSFLSKHVYALRKHNRTLYSNLQWWRLKAVARRYFRSSGPGSLVPKAVLVLTIFKRNATQSNSQTPQLWWTGGPPSPCSWVNFFVPPGLWNQTQTLRHVGKEEAFNQWAVVLKNTIIHFKGRFGRLNIESWNHKPVSHTF